MCLNCGCMRAHDDMGKPGINITYEDVKRAADANAMTVDATLAMIARTSGKDRGDHPAEYRAQMARDLSRLDDDGGPAGVPCGPRSSVPAHGSPRTAVVEARSAAILREGAAPAWRSATTPSTSSRRTGED